MIICLKDISEECFSFRANVSLKFLGAIGRLSEGEIQLLGCSESTCRSFKGYSGTRTLRALRHSST